METRLRARRIGFWLLAALAVALAAVLVRWVGSEWSEATVQGLAALGALWYWAYRSRPRVNLRILHSGGLYLELMNTGNRVAKQVRVKCDPPIPWSEIGVTAISGDTRQDLLGPSGDFGDMAPDQRYVIMFGSASPRTVEVLDKTRFEISHEGTWGFWRRRFPMQFGGSGAQASLEDITATPFGAIAKALEAQQKEFDKIYRSIDALPDRLSASSDSEES